MVRVKNSVNTGQQKKLSLDQTLSLVTYVLGLVIVKYGLNINSDFYKKQILKASNKNNKINKDFY